jgi:transcriptional regulator with XRE-family HTH domain
LYLYKNVDDIDNCQGLHLVLNKFLLLPEVSSREIIGKYERNENLPLIDMVTKMARAFGVTLDYLIGEVEISSASTNGVKTSPSLKWPQRSPTHSGSRWIT